MKSALTILAGLLVGVLVATGILAALLFAGPDTVGLQPTPTPTIVPSVAPSVAPSPSPTLFLPTASPSAAPSVAPSPSGGASAAPTGAIGSGGPSVPTRSGGPSAPA